MSGHSQPDPSALIIEDHAPLARVLRLALLSAGFETHEVREGAEALRMLGEGGIDAVVLDLELKDGLGGAVLARLRGAGAGSVPSWVTISGLDREQAIEHYGLVGSHFLVKPFDVWGLVRILQEDLEKKGGPTSA